MFGVFDSPPVDREGLKRWIADRYADVPFIDGGALASWLADRSRPAPENMLASGLEVAAEVDEGDALDVVLRAGEMSLHHVNIIHGSKANPSDRQRIGFAVRYVSPQARQKIAHHEVLLVRGRDTAHHYRLGTPPREDGASAIAAHAAFEGRRSTA